MKKYLGLVFVLGLVLSGAYLPSKAQAQTGDVGCLPGYKYSNTTGKSCFGSRNSVCTVLDKDFRLNNPNSTMLQDFLFAWGYYDIFNTTNPDGYGIGRFNVATQTAVMNFQEDYGMERDGFIGPKSRNQIRALSCNSSNNFRIPIVEVNNFIGVTNLNVKWKTESDIPSSNVKNLRLQLHNVDLKSGAHSVYGLNTVNDGIESITLPSVVKNGNYRAVIYQIGTPNWHKFGVSDVFKIGDVVNPPTQSVTVLSPNGGEVFQKSAMLVKWSTSNISANEMMGINIFESSNNDPGKVVFEGSVLNDGSEILNLPESIVNGKYLLRISYPVVESTNSISDYSDAEFTITSTVVPANHAPQITLTEVPLNITAGKATTFSLAATDEDGDNISWIVNWGNGISYASEGKDPVTGKNIFCPAKNSGKSVSPSVTYTRAGTYKVNIDLRDCKGGFVRNELEVVVAGPVLPPPSPSAYLNKPTLNTEISTPSRNIAVPTSGLTDGSRASYNFTASNGSLTIREIEYSVAGEPGAIKSIRIGKVSSSVVNGVAKLGNLVLGVPAGQTGINITAYLSYNGVGVNGLPSGAKTQIKITKVLYTFGDGIWADLPDDSVLSPEMILVAPFKASLSANALASLEDEKPTCEYTMTLRMGMDSTEVKCLREALNRRDYSLSSSTMFDEATYKALKEFQSEHYLTTDGVFGSDSQAVLMNNI